MSPWEIVKRILAQEQLWRRPFRGIEVPFLALRATAWTICWGDKSTRRRYFVHVKWVDVDKLLVQNDELYFKF